jgi:hypothetical protein
VCSSSASVGTAPLSRFNVGASALPGSPDRALFVVWGGSPAPPSSARQTSKSSRESLILQAQEKKGQTRKGRREREHLRDTLLKSKQRERILNFVGASLLCLKSAHSKHSTRSCPDRVCVLLSGAGRRGRGVEMGEFGVGQGVMRVAVRGEQGE